MTHRRPHLGSATSLGTVFVTIAVASALASVAATPRSAYAASEGAFISDGIATLLGCERLSERECLMAAAHLRGVGDPALKPVSRALPKMPQAGQLLALSVLQRGRGEAATALIIGVATSRKVDPRVRAMAIDDLSLRFHDKIVPTLLRTARSKSAVVRSTSVRVLSDKAYKTDKRIHRAIIRAAADPAAQVRAQSMSAIGAARITAGAAALVKGLEDDDAAVRRAAAESLLHVKSAKAVVPLIDLLSDRDEATINAAARALKFQTDKPWGNDQSRWRRWLQERENP